MPIYSKSRGLSKRIIWVTFGSIVFECFDCWKRLCINAIKWITRSVPARTTLRKCSSSQACWYKSPIITGVRKLRPLLNSMLRFPTIQLIRRVSKFFGIDCKGRQFFQKMDWRFCFDSSTYSIKIVFDHFHKAPQWKRNIVGWYDCVCLWFRFWYNVTEAGWQDNYDPCLQWTVLGKSQVRKGK